MLKEKFKKPAGSPPAVDARPSGALVYAALAVLTLAFLGALAWSAARERTAEPRGDYSVSVERSATPEDAAAERININTASAEELEALTGIGPALASAIVEYRAEHGGFASVEELINVSGIGEAKLEAIRDYITVGGEE